ncbi:MAG: hypothetical protein ACR2KV_02500 [Solirubrobacteraceae bacterium]
MKMTSVARLRALGPLAVVVLALSACPAPAGARALKGMWGPAVRSGVSLFPVYRDLGIQLYETRIDWATTAAHRPSHPRNPNDPAYAWPAELAAAVGQSRAAGIRVAVQLIGAPRWANGGKPENWAPHRPADFADFAYAAARRYPTVRLWMVWGEPTRADVYSPLVAARAGRPLDAAQRAAPHRYARMLDAAYGALKQAGRANLVIGGMTYTTGDIDTQQWIENLRLPDGRPPRLDLYGHNPFSFRDPNLASPPSASGAVDFSDLRRLAALIDRNLGRHRPQIKLFLSEWTIPTAVDNEFNFYVDPPIQARWITDGLRLARTWSRVYAIGWINLYDDLPTSGGGLIDAQGAKKPGYYAWRRG